MRTSPADPPTGPEASVSRESLLHRAGRNLLGGPGRVTGVDLARGIAVLGMFAAHVGVTSGDLGTPEGWLAVGQGRSSILFALVAGVSLALVTGARTPPAGEALRTARGRILVRAVLLMVLVALLDLLGARVALILGYYAAYFVLALPFLRLSTARLAALAVGTALIGPVLVYYGPEVLARAGLRMPSVGSGAVTDFLLTGYYPAFVWMAYVFAGLAVGRSDLRSPMVQLSLGLGGFGVAAVTSLVSHGLVGAAGGADAVRAAVRATSSLTGATHAWSDPWPPLAGLALEGPHDDTIFEAVGSGAFALGMLGLCLLLGRVVETRVPGWAPRVLRGVVLAVVTPLAAVGAMALTIYSAQVAVIAWWNRIDWDPLYVTNEPLLWLVLGALIFATVWRALLGRGPLERVFSAVPRRVFPASPRGASDATSTRRRT
ncbi:DUF1624 domain-containing protein [Protaetiibacter sp. SSC-01]|uniref:heparan-alpha-glucosaminide N-acetyltransferase domain-containing protein n=1 Tax=Protaetiibacter sp. SSC-01 TaxID=2759943 RepID=UPI0016572917|nr:heparan-alpha-glucosaminide N-acetyltransferase domain-containing protein [Protaetiibacter sp. SSC-01]QNO37741.1 DUF1624 domain-containing protein [Protaetiibacter sp. SSC-01]